VPSYEDTWPAGILDSHYARGALSNQAAGWRWHAHEPPAFTGFVDFGASNLMAHKAAYVAISGLSRIFEGTVDGLVHRDLQAITILVTTSWIIN
jgi:hypothetical protein